MTWKYQGLTSYRILATWYFFKSHTTTLSYFLDRSGLSSDKNLCQLRSKIQAHSYATTIVILIVMLLLEEPSLEWGSEIGMAGHSWVSRGTQIFDSIEDLWLHPAWHCVIRVRARYDSEIHLQEGVLFFLEYHKVSGESRCKLKA